MSQRYQYVSPYGETITEQEIKIAFTDIHSYEYRKLQSVSRFIIAQEKKRLAALAENSDLAESLVLAESVLVLYTGNGLFFSRYSRGLVPTGIDRLSLCKRSLLCRLPGKWFTVLYSDSI